MTPIRTPALFAALLATSLLAALPAGAQRETPQEWVERCRERRDERAYVHCEVRESTLPATGSLAVMARPNGGIRVEGWDRNEILVRAKIQSRGEDQAEARELASEVRVVTGSGSVRSEGPRTSGRYGWSVSYDVFVPRQTSLDLESTNGGLHVSDVQGRIDLETTNGSIALERVSGEIRGETTNGSLDVRLAGSRLQPAGIELETSNGSINLTVPSDFSARLEAATVNGGIHTDFPITVQGRIGRRIEADLGNGGPPVRIHTTNGAIRIRRS